MSLARRGRSGPALTLRTSVKLSGERSPGEASVLRTQCVSPPVRPRQMNRLPRPGEGRNALGGGGDGDGHARSGGDCHQLSKELVNALGDLGDETHVKRLCIGRTESSPDQRRRSTPDLRAIFQTGGRGPGDPGQRSAGEPDSLLLEPVHCRGEGCELEVALGRDPPPPDLQPLLPQETGPVQGALRAGIGAVGRHHAA